jgi:hypothetical protein
MIRFDLFGIYVNTAGRGDRSYGWDRINQGLGSVTGNVQTLDSIAENSWGGYKLTKCMLTCIVNMLACKFLMITCIQFMQLIYVYMRDRYVDIQENKLHVDINKLHVDINKLH